MDADIKSRAQPFYIKLSDREVTPAFRELLVNYTKIPENEINNNLEAVRDDAWDHYPYPSIGLFAWVDLGVSGDDLPKDDPETTRTIASAYQTILSKLKNGGKFLDVGCMFAQDARKLVHDGAPPESVYGTGLRGEYFTYGYKLFRDENIIPRDHFIAGDILDTNNQGRKALAGKLDVINATHVIHVFTLEDQREFIKHLMALLKQEKGVICTGRMAGHLQRGYKKGANVQATTKSGGDIWEHNEESFKELWKSVGNETGTKWDVKAWFWRFGLHSGLGREGWFRQEEHGIVTFIATML